MDPEFLELASLETIDPAAFVCSPEIPQELCNFVLALALIFNDCKDLIAAQMAIDTLKPEGGPARTKQWGAYGGMQHHSSRLLVTAIHELLELIRDNGVSVAHPFLQDVVRNMPAQPRDDWNLLVAASSGHATAHDPLGKILLFTRNKTGAHYDPKALFKGYRRHFLDAERQDDRGFVSRGRNMNESRFFFADAASTGWLNTLAEDNKLQGLLGEIGNLLARTNRAIMHLVVVFIQKRGYSFRNT